MVETRNEKGFTRQQYETRRRKIFRNTFIGVGASLAIGISASIYGASQSAPPQPEGYQTYLDAQQTLSILESRKEQLESPLRDLPYQPESLTSLLGEAVKFDQEKWNQVINAANKDISQMEANNPRLSSYNNDIDVYRSNSSLIAAGSPAFILLGGFGSILCGFIADKRYGGSDIWAKERRLEQEAK